MQFNFSWSTSWGESGYIRMSKDIKSHCGISQSAVLPVIKDMPNTDDMKSVFEDIAKQIKKGKKRRKRSIDFGTYSIDTELDWREQSTREREFWKSVNWSDIDITGNTISTPINLRQIYREIEREHGKEYLKRLGSLIDYSSGYGYRDNEIDELPPKQRFQTGSLFNYTSYAGDSDLLESENYIPA